MAEATTGAVATRVSPLPPIAATVVKRLLSSERFAHQGFQLDTHAASDLAFGKEVTIQTHGYDKYKRTLGDVFLLDGTNVNQELVKQGWCWWYQKYAPGDTVLEGLEKEAREAKKGLWADPHPVPPWEWRKRK